MPATGTCYFNSFGNEKNALFILEDAPVLANNSFVGWADSEGVTHNPGDLVSLTKDETFTAVWDEYPAIKAYDRYFTLKQAQNGDITVEALLEGAYASDKEDGDITESLEVLRYDGEKFTRLIGDSIVSVTLYVKDSFGNETERMIRVHIVDADIAEQSEQQYMRYISGAFYQESDGSFVATNAGGLEKNSIWVADASYRSALQYALENGKNGEEKATLSLFGKTYKADRAGAGTWAHKVETWTFTRDDIARLENFVSTYGFSRYKNDDATTMFYNEFDSCRK